MNHIAELQKGVLMKLPEGVSVSDFACKVLKISLPVFRREVKTIMLNNQVVDKPDTCELHPGDVLVLSGAMPGLVGAMLRSDSPIKAMRQTISSRSADGNSDDSFVTPGQETSNPWPEDMILVKFFNTILRHHKDAIIDYGFIVQGELNE